MPRFKVTSSWTLYMETEYEAESIGAAKQYAAEDEATNFHTQPAENFTFSIEYVDEIEEDEEDR